MAMRGYWLGNKIVTKESGGKYFPSKAVAWTDNPAARPSAVVARNNAFSSAASRCKGEPKGKGGTVWGVSAYNKCIGRALGKLRKAV